MIRNTIFSERDSQKMIVIENTANDNVKNVKATAVTVLKHRPLTSKNELHSTTTTRIYTTILIYNK